MEMERTQLAKTTLKKNKVGQLVLPDFKTEDKIVIKAEWC